MPKTLEDGIGLLQQGDLEGSTEIFEALIAKDPQDMSAHYWLGNCHALEGSTQKAKAAFQTVATGSNPEFAKEAKEQLRALHYQKWMQFLILDPPLRWLLIFSVIGYALTWGIRATPMQKSAATVELFAVWGTLALFFLWALFIFSYFLGNIAFVSEEHRHKGTRSARIAIGLAGLFVIPANLLLQHGWAIKLLALFLDAFLLCLLVSRALHKWGIAIAGDTGGLLPGMGTMASSPNLPAVDPAHSAHQAPSSSKSSSSKKKKKIKK